MIEPQNFSADGSLKINVLFYILSQRVYSLSCIILKFFRGFYLFLASIVSDFLITLNFLGVLEI